MNWLRMPESIDHLTGGAAPLDPAGHTGLLVVLPHPDDESFAAGGTIARFADAGLPVLYLCGTFGDSGRRMGCPLFANRESLRDIREVELREACRELGCSYRILGLRDKTVEFEDPAAVADFVSEVLAEKRFSAVITFYPGHGVHPDHDALGHATELAVGRLPEGERPLLLGVAVGNPADLEELGEPDWYSDIRATVSRKIAALRAHRSQTEFMFQQLDREQPDLDEHTSGFRSEAYALERFYELPRPA